MSSHSTSDSRLNFRLPADLKRTVEQAAALTGQTVSDYAASVLAGNARRVIEEHDLTVLTNQDRDAFLAMLDQTDAKPNAALKAAVRRYKTQLPGKS